MSENESRPRRSARVPPKIPITVAAQEPTPTPKKRQPRDGELDLNHLLTNPKSKLTTMDISDILNYENFLRLPEESQQTLCGLLPETAFVTYQNNPHPAHSAYVPDDGSVPKPATGRSPATLDPMFFSNAFFLSAAHTFQDYLFSGWLSAKEKEKVEQFEAAVQEGSMHAQWKDEEWEQTHGYSETPSRYDLDLVALVRQSHIREGDILVYRRNFASLGVLVEKELLVHWTGPSSTLDFLLQPATVHTLPSYLLHVAPEPPVPPIHKTEGIMSSIELEDAVLDIDGRVTRELRASSQTSAPALRIDFTGPVLSDAQRSNQAAKSLSVWRWHEDRVPEFEVQSMLPKGGREYCGTIYYLRRA